MIIFIALLSKKRCDRLVPSPPPRGFEVQEPLLGYRVLEFLLSWGTSIKGLPNKNKEERKKSRMTALGSSNKKKEKWKKNPEWWRWAFGRYAMLCRYGMETYGFMVYGPQRFSLSKALKMTHSVTMRYICIDSESVKCSCTVIICTYSSWTPLCL